MDICKNKDYMDGSSFWRNFALRIWSHICLKTIGATVFMTLFFIAYFYLLKNPFFAVIQIKTNTIDDIVGFVPVFIYFYLSLWVYVSLPPILIKSRKELIAYGFYVGALCVSGIVFYALIPTAVPPYAVDWSSHPEFAFLRSVDMSGNAFPSMHVATALFSWAWLHRELKEMKASHITLAISAAWCLGIIYSTMATKQHVFYDVVGGIVLGGLFAFLTLRDYNKRFILKAKPLH